ncbi:hypothetical protein GCM10010129_77070 [Streptomyces fumigatiscleroticus]|nr:hypothetical protein GCM10010129_77070 [Streptomyces fumigatiscleroticus]
MPQKTVRRPTHAITLTDAAVAKIEEWLRDEEPGLALHIFVEPGGCSGLRYKMMFSDQYRKGLARTLAERNGQVPSQADEAEAKAQLAALVTDTMTVQWFGSVPLIMSMEDRKQFHGARIDYVEDLNNWGFAIDNPNLQASCACSSDEPCG